MGIENFNTEDKFEFRQIILGHIKQVLSLTLRSDREGDKLGLFINAVETLSDVLIPFYDEQMNKDFQEFQEEIKIINLENAVKLKELSPHDYYESYVWTYRNKKKIAHRNLFRKLNLLLKRNDYLKESVYGEDSADNEVIEEEASEGEE